MYLFLQYLYPIIVSKIPIYEQNYTEYLDKYQVFNLVSDYENGLVAKVTSRYKMTKIFKCLYKLSTFKHRNRLCCFYGNLKRFIRMVQQRTFTDIKLVIIEEVPIELSNVWVYLMIFRLIGCFIADIAIGCSILGIPNSR